MHPTTQSKSTKNPWEPLSAEESSGSRTLRVWNTPWLSDALWTWEGVQVEAARGGEQECGFTAPFPCLVHTTSLNPVPITPTPTPAPLKPGCLFLSSVSVKWCLLFGGGCSGGGLVAKSCPTLATLWARKPARLLCPWDSPSKNTGVGGHVLLPSLVYRDQIGPRRLNGFQGGCCLPPGQSISAAGGPGLGLLGVSCFRLWEPGGARCAARGRGAWGPGRV